MLTLRCWRKISDRMPSYRNPFVDFAVAPNVSFVSEIDEAKEICVAYDKQRNGISQRIKARTSVTKKWEK